MYANTAENLNERPRRPLPPIFDPWTALPGTSRLGSYDAEKIAWYSPRRRPLGLSYTPDGVGNRTWTHQQ